MLSERSKRIALRLAIAFFGVASAALFVLLWKPFFSYPEEQNAVAASYGPIPAMWTLAAFFITLTGLLLGRVLPMQISAALAGVVLVAGAVWVWWSLRTMARPEVASAVITAMIAGSLLPPLLFGWLVGYGRRVRRAASAIPN